MSLFKVYKWATQRDTLPDFPWRSQTQECAQRSKAGAPLSVEGQNRGAGFVGWGRGL